MAKEILSRGVTRRAVLGGMAGVAALSIAGRVSAAGGEAPALAQLAKEGSCRRSPSACRKSRWS